MTVHYAFGSRPLRAFAVAGVAYVLVLCLGIAVRVDAQRIRRTSALGVCAPFFYEQYQLVNSNGAVRYFSDLPVNVYCSVQSDSHLAHHEATQIYVGGTNVGRPATQYMSAYDNMQITACVRSIGIPMITCGIVRYAPLGNFLIRVDPSAWVAQPGGVPYISAILFAQNDTVSGFFFSAP